MKIGRNYFFLIDGISRKGPKSGSGMDTPNNVSFIESRKALKIKGFRIMKKGKKETKTGKRPVSGKGWTHKKACIVSWGGKQEKSHRRGKGDREKSPKKFSKTPKNLLQGKNNSCIIRMLSV
jgi:hypothetical protein